MENYQSKKEYQKALEQLEKVFDSKKGDKDFSEAELLVLLIEKYESETEPAFRNPDPIEILKYKMDIKNLKNKDLAEIVGSKSKASEILNRKRK
ncbi:MAG: transcriptional regulator [Saprospiraceae bacterium]